MSKMITDSKNYEDIADAIRAKNASSDTYEPGDMAQAIDDIPTGSDKPYIEITNMDSNGYTTGVALHNYNNTTGKTRIDAYQFLDYTYLSKITGLEDITAVSGSAFSNFSSKSFSVPSLYIPLPKCEIIGASAFAYRRNGTTTVLINPKIMKNIYNYAFNDVNPIMLNPTEIIEDEEGHKIWNFDELVTVGQYAFHNSGLNTRVFADSIIKAPKLTNVPDEAFTYCGMIVFEAPNLTTIGSKAFSCTPYLRKIWIKSGGTVTASAANKAPFYYSNENLEIFTDAESKPSTWGSYFDLIDSTSSIRATVHYGSTYQDFLDA